MSASRDGRPIFVLGSHRSGSTLLRYILDAHPNIACPPESKFILGIEAFLDSPQALRGLHGLGFPVDEVRRKLRDFIEVFLGGYAERRNKPRWADKTPNYYRIAPMIDRIFAGEAIYIVIVRHPLDCIQSFDEKFVQNASHEDPDIAANAVRYGKGRYGWAHYWIDVYGRIHTFVSALPDRAITVHYEDLVQDSRATVGRMFDFLGEDCPGDILEAAFKQPHTPGFQDQKIDHTSGIHDRSVGRWSEWPASEAAALWRLVADVAALFGYAPP